MRQLTMKKLFYNIGDNFAVIDISEIILIKKHFEFKNPEEPIIGIVIGKTETDDRVFNQQYPLEVRFDNCVSRLFENTGWSISPNQIILLNKKIKKYII